MAVRLVCRSHHFICVRSALTITEKHQTRKHLVQYVQVIGVRMVVSALIVDSLPHIFNPHRYGNGGIIVDRLRSLTAFGASLNLFDSFSYFLFHCLFGIFCFSRNRSFSFLPRCFICSKKRKMFRLYISRTDPGTRRFKLEKHPHWKTIEKQNENNSKKILSLLVG